LKKSRKSLIFDPKTRLFVAKSRVWHSEGVKMGWNSCFAGYKVQKISRNGLILSKNEIFAIIDCYLNFEVSTVWTGS